MPTIMPRFAAECSAPISFRNFTPSIEWWMWMCKRKHRASVEVLEAAAKADKMVTDLALNLQDLASLHWAGIESEITMRRHRASEGVHRGSR